MGGESVVVAGPAPSGRAIPDFALVVEPTDRAKAQGAVQKIVTLLARRGLRLAQQPVTGGVAYAFPRPVSDGVKLLHDQLGANLTARAWVDAIDRDLAELVKRRLDVARVIGDSKRQTGRAVLDPKREAAVRRTYYEALSGSKDLADKLVDLLIEAARAQQSIEE